MSSNLRKKLFKQKTQDAPSTSGMSKNKGAFARSKSIDQQIDAEREKRRHEVQLLILGGASGGKSTFIKQLRLHHGDGFPEDGRASFLPHLYENLVDAFHVVIENMGERGVECEKPENSKFAKELAANFPKSNHYHVVISTPCLLGASGGEVIRPTSPGLGGRDRPPPPDYSLISGYKDNLLALWEDTAFQKTFHDRDQFEFRLRPEEEFFLSNVERVLGTGYVPNVQDILFIRQPTHGVEEHMFTTNGLQYRVIDVAGQQNQRKKWIHFFEGVTAVIFFAALNGYCETLEEDRSTNALLDSLNTFDEVAHNKYLVKTDFILFLNKKDVYEKRIHKQPLSVCFPDYTGSNSVDESIKHIQRQFEAKSNDKQMYVHVSCAIDTSLMKKLIGDVMQIIIEINLRKASRPL